MRGHKTHHMRQEILQSLLPLFGLFPFLSISQLLFNIDFFPCLLTTLLIFRLPSFNLLPIPPSFSLFATARG